MLRSRVKRFADNISVLPFFVLALIIVLLLDLWLFDVPEFWDKGYEIGMLIYNISLSIIAASIFYYVTTHLRDQKAKKYVYPYIKSKVYRIVTEGKLLFERLADSAGVQLEGQYPNDDELQIICEKINPWSTSPITTGILPIIPLTWQQYFEQHKAESLYNVALITAKIMFIEPQLIKMVHKYEGNDLFKMIDLFQRYKHSNSNLVASHKLAFQRYIALLEALDEYYNREFKRY